MPRAEVRLSTGEGVEVLASEQDRNELIRRLRGAQPPVRVRRAGQVLRVSFADAGRLEELTPYLEWHPAAARALRRRDAIRRAAPAVLQTAREIACGPVVDAANRLGDWSGRVPLDDHQVRNVAVMTEPSGWGACIFDEQGTGKTVTTIAAFDVLVERRAADTLVLVAPKSMVGEWKAELERFCGDLYEVALVGGSRRDRIVALSSGADVFVFNYEAAVKHEDDVRLLLERRDAVLVIDESFNVKNPRALRTEALVRLREAVDRCYVLCGTPAPNSADDLVAQFDLADLGYTFGPQPRSPQSLEPSRIRAAMEQRGLFTRNLKRAVLPELPARRISEVSIELGPQQKLAYRQALDDLIADLRRVDDQMYHRNIMSFLERRSALLRICSNPTSLVPGFSEEPAKLQALERIVAPQVEQGEKVVVWSFYRDSLQAIDARLARYGVARIDGSVGDAGERRDAIARFQEDDETMVFLGNPAAAGAGITLHRARLAVYESLSNQAAHWMQSLDRIHRRGQVRESEYVVLVARGTIEEVEFQRLRRKADTQADLLGDVGAELPSRELMLDELLHPDG